MTITSGGTLSAQMRAVEAEFPHWHLFASDAGRIWAATTQNRSGGSGTTLDANSPVLMRLAIAEQQHRWVCGEAAA